MELEKPFDQQVEGLYPNNGTLEGNRTPIYSSGVICDLLVTV